VGSDPSDEAEPFSLFVGQVLGDYRLEGKGGQGGFARVLRATRLTDGKQVALKLLRRKHRGQERRENQLMREGRILRALDHPKVLGCHEVGRVGPWNFLVLPWIEGEPLSITLARGPMARSLALDCAFQALEALEYVHKRGVVHYDIKPDNLLLSPNGTCILFDFGLALTRQQRLRERASGGVARIAGTSTYRAPEQSTPGAEVEAPADIYAFGVTLYRMLTGKVAKGGQVEAGLVGEELADLLEQCLCHDPRERPIARRLRQALHELPSQ
jgi:serine/threonine protein kinase